MDFCDAFLEKYPNRVGIIENYLKPVFGHYPTWDDFTLENINKLVSSLKNNMAASSAKVTCARIKSVLNQWNDEDGISIPCKKFGKALKVKPSPSQAIYLNEEEIHRIESLKYDGNMEATRLRFLIECYTGMRFSDVRNIRASQIQNGRIYYVSQKTGIPTSMPVHKKLLDTVIKAKKYDDPIPMTYNRSIKKIAQDASIMEEVTIFHGGQIKTGPKYTFVASHTARRSFCCNLYNRGVDITSISKLAGHSSIEITKRYIVCGIKENDANIDAFFNDEP